MNIAADGTWEDEAESWFVSVLLALEVDESSGDARPICGCRDGRRQSNKPMLNLAFNVDIHDG